MTPALEATFRLATQLPVRTHLREYDTDPAKLGGRTGGREYQRRRAKVLEMHAMKFNGAAIARSLGVTKQAVYKMLKRRK